MFEGDPRYFVCDLNANTIINFSTVDGEPIKSHLNQANVDKQLEEDPDAAQRELFNRFTTGGGEKRCCQDGHPDRQLYCARPGVLQ